jgi:hypothetical protein
MPRITKENLEYCVNLNKCLDCYIEDKDVAAVGFQQRKGPRVPCCRQHFEDYKAKVSQTNVLKYARRSARRQKLGRCICCQSKLIPRELLPPWMHDISCGVHGAWRPNRVAMFQFIRDYCLTPEERKGMKLQNIIYKRDEGLVFIGIQYPDHYSTQAWAARDLERRYREVTGQSLSFD